MSQILTDTTLEKQGFPKKNFLATTLRRVFLWLNFLIRIDCVQVSAITGGLEAVGGVSPWASLRPPTTGVGLPDSPITGSTAPVPVIFCKSGMFLKFFPYMANHTMINYRGGHTLRSLNYFLYLFQYSGLTPIQKTSLSLVLILIGPNHRHP